MNQPPETPTSQDPTSPDLTNPDSSSQATNHATNTTTPQRSTAPPSFIKLAMRNMVRKGSTSLFHFGLTAIGLLGLLVGLAYLTR